MKPLKAELMILIVTIFWGSSYLFMKLGLDSLGEFNLIALRFGLAFLVAGAIFHRKFLRMSKELLSYSILLGFILFVIFTAVTFGLNTTTTSNAGFLISLTVVFVPLINTNILKNKIEWKFIFSTAMAITGIALLTLRAPFSMRIGDLLCIVAALLYALHIIIVGYATKKVDALQLGILQLGFAGLFGLIFSLLFETPRLPNTSQGWIAILVLSIVCSAFGFIFQVIAQKYTSPDRTGLIFSLEPVFAALFGYLFVHEVMSFKGMIGAILVFLGVVLSTTKMKYKQRNLDRGINWKN
ncbi:DMT family transporter [Heyndrickxia sporothermodurans]|uniref:DMT family transporter n=1 Tax=Heyndrickxia sporothermodurans TaxID=46224 RepID=UPI0035D816E8